jgi:hypothetical protein
MVYENESVISFIHRSGLDRMGVLGRGESTEMEPLFTILPPLGDWDFMRMNACFVHCSSALLRGVCEETYQDSSHDIGFQDLSELHHIILLNGRVSEKVDTGILPSVPATFL